MAETSPLDVLRAWFAAHAAGDLNAASALMRPGAPVVVQDRRLSGFEDLMRWYAERWEREGPDFRYEVIEALGGQNHAVALLDLSSAGRTWRQVAVYTIEVGQIVAVHAYEGPC